MKYTIRHQLTSSRKLLSRANRTSTVKSCLVRTGTFSVTHLQKILYDSSGGGTGYFDTFGRLAAAGMSANTVPRIASCGR